MLRGFRGWLLLALAGAWGCRSAGWVPCFRQGDGATAQLAPSGRAVALVHASHYRALAGGEHPASLSCICDEARALFEREPDALVVVLNYDEATVRFNRAMIELGYDPFDWPEPLPPALIAAMQAIDDGLPARPDPGTPFQLGLVVLAGSVLTAQEWEFYERAMDFMSAQDARRIHESFAAEQFRAERAHWQAIERGTESALLNFFGATGGRGSLVFSRPRLHDQGPLRHRRTTTTPSGTTQIIGGSGSSTARAPAI